MIINFRNEKFHQKKEKIIKIHKTLRIAPNIHIHNFFRRSLFQIRSQLKQPPSHKLLELNFIKILRFFNLIKVFQLILPALQLLLHPQPQRRLQIQIKINQFLFLYFFPSIRFAIRSPSILKIVLINLKILQSIILRKEIILKLLQNNHNKQIQHNKLSNNHKKNKKQHRRYIPRILNTVKHKHMPILPRTRRKKQQKSLMKIRKIHILIQNIPLLIVSKHMVSQNRKNKKYQKQQSSHIKQTRKRVYNNL